MIGKLNEAEIEQVLQRQAFGRLGCHSEGKTYIVPISYAYDGEFIYVHTFEGMKVNMLRNNPQVCFQVDKMKHMANWKSVICWGEFEELTEPEERLRALQILTKSILPLNPSITTHLSPNWPFSSRDLSNIEGVVFRIRLTEKSGRFEKNEESPAYVL